MINGSFGDGKSNMIEEIAEENDMRHSGIVSYLLDYNEEFQYFKKYVANITEPTVIEFTDFDKLKKLMADKIIELIITNRNKNISFVITGNNIDVNSLTLPNFIQFTNR